MAKKVSSGVSSGKSKPRQNIEDALKYTREVLERAERKRRKARK